MNKPGYDVERFKNIFEHEYTWLNGFMRNVHRYANRAAAYDGASEREWTYAELNADANRLAHAFLDDGLKKHDVSMFMLFNSPEFLFSYIAGHKTGVISCPVNFRLSEGEIALQLEDSKPKIFMFGSEFAETARKALAMSSHKPKRVVVVGPGEIQAGETRYEDYVKERPTENPESGWKQHIYDETVRLYTSGTTNRAKGVPINCINEVLSAHDIIMHFPLNPTDRTMNMTPWFHRGGIHSGGPTPTLYAGGEVLILREFNPRKCLQLAVRKKATFLIGVPSIIALLARAQENEHADLSSLRGIVTMGSPFDKATCERYMKLLTPNIFNGYGTTETFWNTFLRPYNLPEMAGSAGQACTDDEVLVVRIPKDGSFGSPRDTVTRDNQEIGEIIIRAPAKSTGCYFNNKEMESRKFHDGYHYTGDLGTWNENEFVTVVGRKDDMIISAGENIYPTQIEAILNENPRIAECAVVGVPDKRHGQRAVAFVVPADDSLTEEDLRAFCIAHPMLPSFKYPKRFYLVKELPHTATGKIMHYKIREQAADIPEEASAQ